MKTITEQEKKIFNYLNDLRDSGITNMWGASPYVAEEFEMEASDASKVTIKWMSNFNADGYDHLLIKN